MQIFNFLNARKINDERNIFEGMFSSLYFPVIVFIIIIMQILICTFGNIAFRLAPWGVGIIGWLICCAFGLGTLPWAYLMKTIDEDKIKCPACGKKQPTPEELNRAGSLSLKRLHSGRRQSQNGNPAPPVAAPALPIIAGAH